MICELAGVSYAYPGARRQALKDVYVEVAPGEHVAVVGPNGAGKSTLLRVLTGVVRPHAGRVRVFGRDPSTWRRREIARNLAVVSQEAEAGTGIVVRDLVRMGRHPYVSPWASLRAEDEAVVDRCLSAVDLLDMADRSADTLSGGELQRARLARALAQEPRLLLLDEPTAHLDPGHEARFMAFLTQYVQQQLLTVVSITHHLSTAARHADRMVLMSEGSIIAQGPGTDVLDPALLERAFGWPFVVVNLGPLGLQAVPGPFRDAGGGS